MLKWSQEISLLCYNKRKNNWTKIQMTSSFFPIYVTVSSFETVRNHIIFMRKQHSAGHYRNQNPKISIACLIHYCSCFFQQGEGRKPNAINQKRRSGNGNDDVCHLRDSSMSGRSTSGIPLFLHQHQRQKPKAISIDFVLCCFRQTETGRGIVWYIIIIAHCNINVPGEGGGGEYVQKYSNRHFFQPRSTAAIIINVGAHIFLSSGSICSFSFVVRNGIIKMGNHPRGTRANDPWSISSRGWGRGMPTTNLMKSNFLPPAGPSLASWPGIEKVERPRARNPYSVWRW